MHRILSDIRFWILFFLILRLYAITNAPLEVAHNWRQTTVTMAARNFLETDNNIIYPRIDFAGEKTGITGMEFPLLNYIIYLISKIFGYQHWYGRLVNLFVSSFGLYYFYKLIRKYFSENTSFASTIILAVSIWFQYSRKIMPDTFSVSLILAGLYFGTNYLEGKNPKHKTRELCLSFTFLLLGILAKLPSCYLLVLLIFQYSDKNISSGSKMKYAFALLMLFVPVYIWYFYWVPFLVHTYGFSHFFMGNSLAQGFTEIKQNLHITLEKFYDNAMKYSGFICFLGGLIYASIKKDKRILLSFAITSLGFLVIMLKSGGTFAHHSYYIIPFVPVMALVAGFGISKIKKPLVASLILIIVSVEGIANQHVDFRIKEKDVFLLEIEKELDKFSNRNDLIIINSGDIPTPMYFAHRKGWINTNEKISDLNYITELKSKGLKYILILKKTFGEDLLINKYTLLADNEDFRLYKI